MMHLYFGISAVTDSVQTVRVICNKDRRSLAHAVTKSLHHIQSVVSIYQLL